jgi:hypothetical protein
MPSSATSGTLQPTPQSATPVSAAVATFALAIATFITLPARLMGGGCYEAGENFGLTCRDKHGPGPACEDCGDDLCIEMGGSAGCLASCFVGVTEVCGAS